ncbi:MAG: hypothetical protein DI629_11150 [Mesorhizobium amorphae]|nr:MAG: hypothetical protein DI629_11150 [Mesorhizobium amorphae]
MNAIFLSTLIFACVGAGLVGGIFFAFSTFVIHALDRLPAVESIAAMQSINVAVLNPLFFAAFFGTGLAAAVLLASTAFLPSNTRAFVIAALLAYVVGSIFVTVSMNVPLNENLASLPASAFSLQSWRDFRDPWLFWNHVRTACSLAAAAGFALALAKLAR